MHPTKPFASSSLSHHGATLLFPDLPPHSALGIDQSIHTTSEHFKGVKHVPPGVHVVSYAAYDQTGDRYGPVTAFFIDVPAITRSEDDTYAREGMARTSEIEAWMMDSAFHGPVLAWTWVGAEEVLVEMEEDDRGRAESMVRDLRWDRELGSYYTMMQGEGDGDGFEDWRMLSRYLDGRMAKRLSPVEGGISGTVDEDHGVLLGSTRSAAEVALSEQLAGANNGGTNNGGGANRHIGRCRYTRIPDPLIKDPTLTAAELTAWNLDKSAVLVKLFTEAYKGRTGAFLGEMQFAFLAFLLGHSLEGFLQWKRMLCLLLGCDAALRDGNQKHVDFFVAAFDLVWGQLTFSFRKERDAGLTGGGGGDTIGELFEDHFVRGLVTAFVKENADDASLDIRIRNAVEKLAKLVQTELGWATKESLVDLDEPEDSEDGPVIVYI